MKIIDFLLSLVWRDPGSVPQAGRRLRGWTPASSIASRPKGHPGPLVRLTLDRRDRVARNAEVTLP